MQTKAVVRKPRGLQDLGYADGLCLGDMSVRSTPKKDNREGLGYSRCPFMAADLATRLGELNPSTSSYLNYVVQIYTLYRTSSRLVSSLSEYGDVNDGREARQCDKMMVVVEL